MTLQELLTLMPRQIIMANGFQRSAEREREGEKERESSSYIIHHNVDEN